MTLTDRAKELARMEIAEMQGRVDLAKTRGVRRAWVAEVQEALAWLTAFVETGAKSPAPNGLAADAAYRIAMAV